MKKIKDFFKGIQGKFYAWLDRDLVEAASRFLGSTGSPLGSPATFGVLNPMSVAVFEAGLIIGEKSLKSKVFGQRVFWYGDLNLTFSMDNLVGLSRMAGDTITVMDPYQQVVATIRSVGDENEIKVRYAGVELDDDGRYCWTKAAALVRNKDKAKSILDQRGWLPGHLIEFYGLKKPRKSKGKKKRAKKRA